MSNPYQSPAFDPKKFQDLPAYAPPPNYSGMVQQVRIVAILNIVQGSLEIPMGLMTMSVSLLFPVMMQIQSNNPNFKKEQEPPKEFLWFMAALYLVLGEPVVIGGI